MQNLNLSANVKQYFVHALKGVGLRETNPQSGSFVEMSERDILQFLENPQTTTSDIYERIKLAVVQQLQNDAQSDKFIQNNTAFDRQILKSILTKTKIGNFKFADKVCDVYLRNLTAAGVSNDGKINTTNIGNNLTLECTAEVVMMSVIAGLKDQHLSDNEKDEAGQLWNEVLFVGGYAGGYKNWLINITKTYQPDLPYTEQTPSFKEYQQREVIIQLKKETTARCGDPKLADKLLNCKVNRAMMEQLALNDELIKQSCEYCSLRLDKKNPDPNKDLCLCDVLAVLSDEGKKAQVVTFFQDRSREQSEDLKANPKTSEVTRQNKIGNVIGNAGRKFVKEQTGSGVAVDFDKGSGLGKGKKGPWRGYKPLYDAILSFLKDLYSNVMTIGFVTKIMEKDGYFISPEDAEDAQGTRDLNAYKDVTDAWKTDYQQMNDGFKEESQSGQEPTLNVAGEFYNKTKARLLADKMRLSVKQTQIDDDYMQSHPDLSQLKEQATYLEQRIATAEKILKEQIPNPDSPAFKDPRYFEMLESQIIAEDANQQNVGVQNFLKGTKNNSANDEMGQAVQLFGHLVTNGTTPNQQQVKREMAKELFHLHGKYENKEITDQDLDGMANRFVQSGALNQIRNDLNELSASGQNKREQNPNVELNSQDYKIAAVDANAAINQFVVKDLQQHVAKEQYSQYRANQARSEIMDAVIAERGM